MEKVTLDTLLREAWGADNIRLRGRFEHYVARRMNRTYPQWRGLLPNAVTVRHILAIAVEPQFMGSVEAFAASIAGSGPKSRPVYVNFLRELKAQGLIAAIQAEQTAKAAELWTPEQIGHLLADSVFIMALVEEILQFLRNHPDYLEQLQDLLDGTDDI